MRLIPPLTRADMLRDVAKLNAEILALERDLARKDAIGRLADLQTMTAGGGVKQRIQNPLFLFGLLLRPPWFILTIYPARVRNYRESNFQEQCVAWFRNQYPNLSKLFIYINNNASSAKAGARNKRMGTVKGIPDLFLAVPTADSCGLWIELKAKGGKARAEQLAIHSQLRAQGFKVAVVDTFAGFKVLIREHIAAIGCSGTETTIQKQIAPADFLLTK